ncbi:MAG: Integral membrane protein MviN [Candidatus Collierbacteria bacterium GW2011_GWB1_44_6]|uniref:Probable lipid II flippase MurJ n=1 Tax=Candidatus Collierbacteria bacterium GW2011_GWB1_44_6 TaxID=1618384 RepID=A0A0G1JP97_9BACT|nr:MAG: Integral membrane protein MviN [Candidatus Collierbacteria bacterium GW2011_GWB1_44_6]KKT83693.1 MAG: Integral membrane protein MviN [Microgenomates group bacterium GW2011_GWC1_44_9]
MVNKIISKSQEFFNRKSNSILSAAAIIGVSYLGSALLGLVKNHLLAARFFGGMETDLDVYFAAFVIPDTVFQLLVVGAVSAAFIPVYQEYFEKSEEEAHRLANTALTTVGFYLLIISTLIAIFARPLAGLLAHFPAEKLDLMAGLIRLMSLAQILFAVSAFLTGVLQSQRRFLIPAIAPLLYNIGTILGIYFLSSRYGIYSAAIGVVFGAFLHMAIQLPTAKGLGYWPGIRWQPKHPGVLSMISLMPPRALSLGLDQIERWVAVNLSSLLAAGSLSIFNFARQLYVLPISLFGVSLSQASFPSLAREALSTDKTQFKSTLSKAILQIFFFALPASVLVLVLRIPLVRLAFGAKNFPWEATLLTGKALAFLSLSIAPQAVTNSLTRALHALKDTKTPLVIGFITMVFFIGSAYLLGLSTEKNVAGITLALSLGNLLDFGLSYWAVRIKVGPLGISTRIFKMVIVSLFTAVSLWLPMRLLDQLVFDTTRTLPLIILTLVVSSVGFCVYLFFCWLFEIEELKDVIYIVKKVGNWRKILASSDEVLETTPNNI